MKKSKPTFSKTTPTIDESTKLNTSAVDRLVEAANDDASGVSVEEEKKYQKSKSKFKLPVWLKALLIKWWFVGACCFFFYWGLGNYISDAWLQVLVLGAATGAITDLLTNNFMRLFETSDHEYDKYILFTGRKKVWTLFANVVYGLVLTFVIVFFYDAVNALIIKIWNMDPTSVPFGVEPVSYGLVYLGFDMAIISIKNLIVKLIKNKKENK